MGQQGGVGRGSGVAQGSQCLCNARSKVVGESHGDHSSLARDGQVCSRDGGLSPSPPLPRGTSALSMLLRHLGGKPLYWISSDDFWEEQTTFLKRLLKGGLVNR